MSDHFLEWASLLSPLILTSVALFALLRTESPDTSSPEKLGLWIPLLLGLTGGLVWFSGFWRNGFSDLLSTLLAALCLMSAVLVLRARSQFSDRRLPSSAMGCALLSMVVAALAFLTQPNWQQTVSPSQWSTQPSAWLFVGAMLLMDLLTLITLSQFSRRTHLTITVVWLATSTTTAMALTALATLEEQNAHWELALSALLMIALLTRLSTPLLPKLASGLRETSLLALSALTIPIQALAWWLLATLTWSPLLLIVATLTGTVALFLAAWQINSAGSLRSIALITAHAAGVIPLLVATSVPPATLLLLALGGMMTHFVILVCYSLLLATVSWDDQVSSTGGLADGFPTLSRLHGLLTLLVAVQFIGHLLHAVVFGPTFPGLGAMLICSVTALLWSVFQSQELIFYGPRRANESAWARMKDVSRGNAIITSLMLLVLVATIAIILKFLLAADEIHPLPWNDFAQWLSRNTALSAIHWSHLSNLVMGLLIVILFKLLPSPSTRRGSSQR